MPRATENRSTARTTTSIAVNERTIRGFRRSRARGGIYQPHIAEDKTPFFEACLPVEEIARRGRETLRFGPMKAAGLPDPRTGRWPYAVVQLRQENQRADSYNLVGFQNHMRFGDQARVFRLIPGLENAEFLRFGQMHRNTYINSPALLRPTLQLKAEPEDLLCGTDIGRRRIRGGDRDGSDRGAEATGEPAVFPRETALGSLCHYITQADPENFQPANITFDLLPPLDSEIRDKKERHAAVCRRAEQAFEESYTFAWPRYESVLRSIWLSWAARRVRAHAAELWLGPGAVRRLF